MLLQNTQEKTKRLFNLKFTEELIRNYKPMDLFRLKEKIKMEEKNSLYLPSILYSKKESKKEIKKFVKERLLNKPKKKKIDQSNFSISFKNKLSRQTITKEPKFIPLPLVKTQDTRILRIPELRLPKGLDYLKPAITYEKLNLGKLGILISDSNVEVIECPGANQKIIVEGKMGRKPTGIILEPKDINDILLEFSSKSKIPINEGITKISIGGLVLTAIISDSEYHFMIKKIKKNTILMPPHPIY